SGSKPRISIGMPLYNRENYVAASIDAHLCQTYDDFELIITDNASTDRGPEICRAYAAKDPRVKFFPNPENLGATGNFRRCWELAKGEFFRWTPSDDLVSPNLLKRAVEILDRDPSVFVAYPRNKVVPYNWLHLGANLKSVTRAPIPISEKLRIYSYEARRVLWSRREFAVELTDAIGHAARKISNP